MKNPDHIQFLSELIKDNTSNLKNRSNVASDVARAFINKTGAEVSPQIIYDLDENYNKDGLVELVKYARKMYNSNRAKIEAMNCNMPYELLDSMEGNIPKAKLIWAVAFIFSRSDVYLLFHSSLPVELQKAAQQLTWLPQVKGEILGELIGETVVSRSKSYYSSAEMGKLYTALPHKIETWHGVVTFSWPTTIRQFLQKTYPQPENYNIKTIAEPPKNTMIWEDGETVIFEEIQKLLAYRLQDNISINASGKVAANSFKKMRKTLGIREFMVEDNGFELVRTACLAQMLVSISLKKNQINIDSMGILKQCKTTFEKDFKLLYLLNDLKNHGHVSFYSSYKQQAESAVIELMNRLPVGKWVSVENIVSYCQIHDLKIQPCSVGEYTTLAYEEEGIYGKNKISISQGNAYRFVEKPTLLSALFLFAALGWADIAYNAPDGKLSVDYFSSFDGLKAFKINDLGGYIFGLSSGDYTPKVNKATQDLAFDDQSLLVFCDPDNAVAETVLANYAERVSPTRFRVSSETFLKDCKSKKQLLDKVELFQKSVAPNLPNNWKTFFSDIISKAEPLTAVSDMVVYKIPSQNSDLIRLMAQDAVLKTMVVKAEGFRILVAQSQNAKLKSRLRELGYLMG